MPLLTLMVGPPGCGKTTMSKTMDVRRINQDDDGRIHLELFHEALKAGVDIVVDRMNFSVEQRKRYITPAKDVGYEVRIHVFYVPYEVCLARCLERKDHPTIKDRENALAALSTFFRFFEYPTHEEATLGIAEHRHNDGFKPPTIIVDLDGTLTDCTHREHFVRDGEKDWKSFLEACAEDPINDWCFHLIQGMQRKFEIVFCSGRGEEYRLHTQKWLDDHGLSEKKLFMRPRKDHRQDSLIKEIILDFELLPRYKIIFCVDDRKQVTEMWRRRGLTCLQCDVGDF